MKSKGGFILIKIDKNIEDVTSDDFEVGLFKELYSNKMRTFIYNITINLNLLNYTPKIH